MNAPSDSRLPEAYAYCRQIAKREAKNFYYAFRILPKHKSDAMCAVYAFMRRADDLADDESIGVEERREKMAAWTATWKKSRNTASEDPIFLALQDTQQRFGISDELLESLVAGTTLDLYEQSGVEILQLASSSDDSRSAAVQIYRTYSDLYRYCYLVASVVGLVCIRIFGYTDPRAEEYAEQVGVAFQLTNIVRDIVEDAQRGRIYLPQEDLAASQVTLEDFLRATTTGIPSPHVVNLLEEEIARAEKYYEAVEKLIPLLEADSRVAMEVLAGIYQELLRRIAVRPEAVLRGRVSVPTVRKLSIFAGGLIRAQFARKQR